MNIVVDTNVLISALIKDSMSRWLIVNSSHNLLLPELEIEEIESHKQEILRKSNLSEKEFRSLLFDLLKYVKIIKTEQIINYKEEAFRIIGNIDKDDTIFFATALAFNCPIWSDDLHFKQQHKIKILTISDMINP